MVITAALGNRLALTGQVGGKDTAGVVVIATQFAQIQVQFYTPGIQYSGQHRQFIQRRHSTGKITQQGASLIDHVDATRQPGQGRQGTSRGSRQITLCQEGIQLYPRLTHVNVFQLTLLGIAQVTGIQQPTEQAHVAQIQHHLIGHTGQSQGIQQQTHHFQIAVAASMTKQLYTKLVRQTGGAGHGRASTQRAGAVAKARGGRTAQAVGIHPRHLGGDIRAYAHQAASQLIGNLEGFPFQITTGAVEQGFKEFDQWREYQLIAPALVEIQRLPA